MRLGRDRRVENDLRDAKVISQVNKNETAVITTAVYPPGQSNRLTHVLTAELTASDRFQHGIFPLLR